MSELVIPSVESLDEWLDKCVPCVGEQSAEDVVPLPTLLAEHVKRWNGHKRITGKRTTVLDSISGRRLTMKLLKV